MLKKLFTVLTLLIALPAMANAAVWTVKASSANPTFGSVSPSGYTNLATTTLSKTITVTPGANYKISSIMVDSVDKKVGTATQDVVVPIKVGTTVVVANFATKTFSVTAGPVVGGGGQIASTTTPQVNAGASKSFTVTPYTGYKILTVKDNGTNVALDAFNNLTLTNVQDNHVVTATFGGVTANAGANTATVVGSTVSLTGTGTVPAGDTAAYQWTVVYAPVGASISTATALPAGQELSFQANKVGTYNLKLKVADGALSATSAVAVTVFASAADIASSATNQCLGCHQSNSSFTASKHYSTATVSCPSCHTTSTSDMALLPQPAAVCESCHSAALSTTTHPVALTAAKCVVCHDAHNPATGIAALAPSAHPAVTLYTFEEIGMQMAGGAKVPVQVGLDGKGMPYSPKQTCGTSGCHIKNGIDYTYDKISDHAFHSNQGRAEYQDSADGKFNATKNKPWTQSTAMVGKW
ncbi:MAG TPA: hypothetical protein VIK40_05710 [Geomonas sp.]